MVKTNVENYAEMLRAKADVVESLMYNVRDCKERVEQCTNELNSETEACNIEWRQQRVAYAQTKLDIWNSIIEFVMK